MKGFPGDFRVAVLSFAITTINRAGDTIAANIRTSGNMLSTDQIRELRKLNWQTYPTADYCCNKCNQTVSLNFADLAKHQGSTFSNFNKEDREAFELFASISGEEHTNSFLDFYCPGCKRPVRVYYDNWAGGRPGEHGFSIKFIVD